MYTLKHILTTKWFGDPKLTSCQHTLVLRGWDSPKPLRYEYTFHWWIVCSLILASCQNTVVPVPLATTEDAVCRVTDAQDSYDLRPVTEILADSSGEYELADILTPQLQDQFEPYGTNPDKLAPQLYYWGKIQLQNSVPAAEDYTEWILSYSTIWTRLEIYTQTADGNWEQQMNGTFTPERDKAFVPTAKGNLAKLSLPPGQVVTVYFRGISEREQLAPSFSLWVQHKDRFYQGLLLEKKKSALFAGFLLMMLFYNLILYFFGREPSFLYYSGYLLAVAVYAAHTSDDISDWFDYRLFAEHPAYLNLLKLSLYLGLMSYLAFIMSFLDLRKLLPRWYHFFKTIAYLGIPWMVVYLWVAFRSNFSYALEDRITIPYIALVSLSCFLFIFPLFKTRDRKGYFVVAGVGIISLGCILTIISRVSAGPFTLDYLKVAAIIEILIFSLGLAYRQRQVEQARQKSDFALRESQLIQEKTELEAARLLELNEFKARFYTNITHEFRTPLTVIMGMSENIKGHTQEKALIQRNSKNLLHLISQLLDFSKLESNSLKLRLVHRDILVYLQYLTESFYSAAAQKEIRLVFYSEEKEVLMDYDEDKVQQIVYNLLSNALKFTMAKGRIVLHASVQEQAGQPWLRLKVQDTGSGIPAAELDRIFDRFYQADDANSSHPGGTGIGLSLTKELVELMGGRITVASELGDGTEFVVHLPITDQAPAADDSRHRPDSEISTTATDASLSAAVPELPVSNPSEEARPELLLIEDNPDIVTYIKTIVRNDYRCHTARNGAIGVEKAFELIPDIIISDVMMPEKDGFEVCATLKQDQRTSHIPIILLTAKSAQLDKLEGLKHGADAYLTKPFNKEELTIRLQQLVSMRQQLQLRYASGQLTSSAEEEAYSQEDAFLQQLQEHIEAHLNQTDFGVPELAAAAHLSQMQLYRKLKALTDQTPSRFIRSYRLQRGRDLLRKGELSISEVAYDVGFADPSYFSRTFHEEFKQSPSDFVKSLKSEN